jgi:hypothetical protein
MRIEEEQAGQTISLEEVLEEFGYEELERRVPARSRFGTSAK